MTRHLLIAGFLFSSSAALAETADDKPTTDEAAESVEVEETAAKQGRGGKGRSGGGKPAARSGNGGNKPAARSNGSSASRSNPNASRSNPNASRSNPSASHSATRTNPNASRSHTTSASRPSTSSASRNPTHNASRPSTSSAHRASSSRTAPSAAAANNRSTNAARAHANRPSTRAGARNTHRVYRAKWAPKRWAPSYHRYHLRGVPRYSPRYWGAGVFYYNPPPRRHRVVVVNRTVSGGNAGRADTAPTRAVDRNGDFAFGLRGGTYGSEYLGGGGYSDMGIGLTARFRPVEAVGLEVAYEHHSQNFEDDTQRINNPLQTSVQVYAFPWTRVSPYASVGLTWNSRSITDDYYNAETRRNEIAQQEGTLFGPHAGLGLELALGDSAALNFEGRYINYLNIEEGDPTVPGAVQGTAGLNFYF